MNYNTIAYLIYLPTTIYITVYIGRLCYKYGLHHLKSIFGTEEDLANLVNRLLLIGYYLINIGYAAITLKFWEQIETYIQLINIVSTRLGIIIIFLGIMHYFNLWVTKTHGKKLLTNHNHV
jgi:hypothetical protein